MGIKKIVFIVLGCIFLALGTVGVFLPILPTTPFYLLTVFFFANSSEKLYSWFLGTKLYRDHLESFVKKEGMKLKTKLTILISVTVLMAFGFFMMARKGIWVPCIILAVVWTAHVIYFVFFVKTVREEGTEAVLGEGAEASGKPEAVQDEGTGASEGTEDAPQEGTEAS